LRSWNPLWANVHIFWDIARNLGRARSGRERWTILFGPPGKQPIQEVRADRLHAGKFDPQIPRSLAHYGMVHFIIVLVAAVILLMQAADMQLLHAAAAAFYITISLAAIAGIFEAARWAAPIEAARLGILAAIALVLWWQSQLAGALAISAIAFCVFSLIWFLPRRGSLTEMEIAPVM
jgi:hypothetical protein